MEDSLPPPKKNIVRRLYDWVLHWADTPYGTPALFIISFMESSFFPIPPDVLQIALSVSKSKRSFWYATVSLVGSVLGALLGFLIGYAFWSATQDFFFQYVLPEAGFRRVEALYQQYDFLVILMFALMPFPPYKVFTIAAGVCHLALLPFIVASVIGRGSRFYLVAAIMYFFGPTVKHWIEKYFNILSIVFTIILVGGILSIKYLVK